MKQIKKISLVLCGLCLALAMGFVVKMQVKAYNVGDKFTYEKVEYEVTKTPTKNDKGTCKVIGAKDNAKVIQIYKTVYKNGEEVICNSIADGAFEEHESLKYVKLSAASPIKAIPKNCFKDCETLATVAIDTGSVTKIDKSAFSGCTKLRKFGINSKKLKKSSFKKNCFKGVTNLKIYAPTKSVAKKYGKYIKSYGGTAVKFYSYTIDD